MSTEPVAVSGAIQVLIGAVLFAVSAFNIWSPTDNQTTAIFGLYAAVVAVATILTRSKVSPTPKV